MILYAINVPFTCFYIHSISFTTTYTIGYKPLRVVYEVLRAQIRAAEEEKHKAMAF